MTPLRTARHMMSFRRHCQIACVLLCSGGLSFSQAQELRILTSMPPSLTETFIAAFNESQPETEILILNKDTNSALSEVLRGNSRHFDIFWASAPEAFALLAARQEFDTGRCAAAENEGFRPFAYSSLGWARRSDSSLFMPGRWDDLLMPIYLGKVGMALPSRSGTAHMLVERFLQVRGWDEGWAYFLRLSENIATLSARSFGVVEGVETGRFDLGLTIDFLAQTRPALDFGHEQPAMIFPAQIGLLAGGQAPDLACDFMTFVLSDAGQALLLNQEIRRIPASADVRRAAGQAIPEAMELAIRRSWHSYDPDLAEARYWAVNMIFEIFIADTLPRRRELFARARALHGRAPTAELAAVTRELAQLPLAEAEVPADLLNARPGHAGELTRMTDAQLDARRRWTSLAAAQLDRIGDMLARLEEGAR